MIDLYYWPTPNGWKITLALEEMGLEYKVIYVDISAGDQFEPAFLAISPNNRMPAIVDHDPNNREEGGNGEEGSISVFESGAILEYLAEKTGKFIPQDLKGKYEVRQWLHWQMGGLGPMMGQNSHFRNYAHQLTDADNSYSAERYENETFRLFGVMDRRLADRDFLAGDYSIADMACWGWARLWKPWKYNMDDYPNFIRWYEAIENRPEATRAIDVGRELRPVRPDLDDEAKKKLFGIK
jgi:GST-like protein